MRESCNSEGTEARMAVMAFMFEPVLCGREVVIDSPEQSSPHQSLLRTMVATMAEPEAEVAPVPFWCDALQALVVVEGVEHDVVEVHIQGVSDGSAKGMLA